MTAPQAVPTTATPTILSFPRNATIWINDTVSEPYFYVLIEGTIAVNHGDLQVQDENLSLLKAGDIFGLVPALTKTRYANSLVAVSDCRAVRIHTSQISSYLKSHKNTFMKIMVQCSNELTTLNAHLSGANKVQNESSPDRLLGNARDYLAKGNAYLARAALESYCDHLGDDNDDGSLAEAKQQLSELAQQPQRPAATGNNLHAKKGELVYLENEVSNHIYIIKRGAVKISKLVNGREFILAVLNEGEIFGEMSALTNGYRSATAVAHSHSELVQVRPDALIDSVGDALLLRVFMSFAQRIWNATQRVLIKSFSDANAKLYAFLQILIADQKDRGKRAHGYEHIFDLSLADIKKMLGISGDSDLQPFLTDPNITILDHRIGVRTKRDVDDKVLYYKKRARRNTIDIYNV